LCIKFVITQAWGSVKLWVPLAGTERAEEALADEAVSALDENFTLQ